MPTLFSPLAFAGLTLRNRVAMPPMWSGKATTEGFVTPAIVDYHRVRAAAGTALIIVEHSFVHPQGRHSGTQIGAHDDACVEGLTTLAAAIRAEGAVACLQISHAGARAASRVTGLPVVAPSPVATAREASPDAPMALTHAGIDEVIECLRRGGQARAGGGIRRRRDSRRARLPAVAVPLAPHEPPHRRLRRRSRAEGPHSPGGARGRPATAPARTSLSSSGWGCTTSARAG